jgi:hypothetical protein
MLAEVLPFFDKFRTGTLVAVLGTLSLAVGYVDFVTGPETTFSGIYL